MVAAGVGALFARISQARASIGHAFALAVQAPIALGGAFFCRAALVFDLERSFFLTLLRRGLVCCLGWRVDAKCACR